MGLILSHPITSFLSHRLGHRPCGSQPVPGRSPPQWWASPVSSLSLPRAVHEEEVKEEAALGFRGMSGCHPEELQLINRTQACGVLVDPEGPFAACHQTVAPEPFLE